MENNIWNKIFAALQAIITKQKKKKTQKSVVIPGMVPLLGRAFWDEFCETEHNVAGFRNKCILFYFYFHYYFISELYICNIQTFSL